MYEVVQSRLKPLSLVDIERAHYGTPDLYRKLAVLTNKLRQKFQPGMQSQMGLKLLSCWPDERSEGARLINESGPGVEWIL